MPGMTKPSSRKPRTAGPHVEAGPPLAALTAECRRRFAAAPVGSLARRSAGAAEVALATSRSIGGARRVLADYQLDEPVRAAALRLLDDIADA